MPIWEYVKLFFNLPFRHPFLPLLWIAADRWPVTDEAVMPETLAAAGTLAQPDIHHKHKSAQFFHAGHE
jgi:hypothetical protein